jgi:predicted nucleic acid-binding protein
MAIASCLVDTNILLRMTRYHDPYYPVIDAALTLLIRNRTPLYYTHQNIAELWNAMTRPISSNGFGLSIAEADREVRAIEAGISLLPDNATVYREWRRIVLRYGVSGVKVHDARLAAAMYVHGISHILTMNEADFNRFSGLAPLHPKRVSAEIGF